MTKRSTGVRAEAGSASSGGSELPSGRKDQCLRCSSVTTISPLTVEFVAAWARERAAQLARRSEPTTRDRQVLMQAMIQINPPIERESKRKVGVLKVDHRLRA